MVRVSVKGTAGMTRAGRVKTGPLGTSNTFCFLCYVWICDIHHWTPLFTAPGPRLCMAHGWCSMSSNFPLFLYGTTMTHCASLAIWEFPPVGFKSYSIALLLLSLRKNFFHKELFIMYLIFPHLWLKDKHSYLGVLLCSRRIQILKNSVPVVTSSAWTLCWLPVRGDECG